MRNTYIRSILSLASILFLYACQPQNNQDEKTSFKPLQKAETQFKYARGISVQYFKDYKKVQLFRTSREAQDTLTFILLKRGTTPPKGYAKAQVIEIPVRGIIPLSTTFLEPLDRLGLADKVLAVENKAFVTNENIIRKIRAGQIPEISSGEQFDGEKILSLNPDLLMSSGFGPEKSLEPLREIGLKLVPDLDWQENTPLGRAEWLKYIALFFDREKTADSLFTSIEKKYLQIEQLARNVDKKPLVLLEMPFKDTWYLSGGQSFMVHLLEDAGARYPWAQDTTTGALPLDIEAVYPLGLKADYWINVGTAQHKKDILAVDSRLGDFEAFKNNRIYNNNRRQNAEGGNDYWNSGVLNPHLVLSDLVKIFHPELLPKYEFTYYRKIED